MMLIVEEEKLQLVELNEQITESAATLNLMKEEEEFDKQNELLKKEIDRARRALKITKQSKYRRDTLDFETDQISDLTIRRGRSGSTIRGPKSHSRNRRDTSPSSQEEGETPRTVTF